MSYVWSLRSWSMLRVQYTEHLQTGQQISIPNIPTFGRKKSNTFSSTNLQLTDIKTAFGSDLWRSWFIFQSLQAFQA